MMSFKAALILFCIGLIGLGLALYGDLSNNWTLASAAIGIGAWFVAAIWGVIDRTFGMIHHLKRSWAIHKDFKEEKALEEKQIIQRGTSKAKKRAAKRRFKLWINTILGVRD